MLERKKEKIISLWKTLSYMPSNTHSIMNVLLPEFRNTNFSIMKIIIEEIQPGFASVINLDSKQHGGFFVMGVVLHHSATWLVVMAVPRWLMFCVWVELVFSYCFFKQGKLRAVTLLWQVYLEDPWFSHYNWRHHIQTYKTTLKPKLSCHLV